MSIYIIFLDGEIKGYLKDEEITKKAVSSLADKLILYIEENSSQIRVFKQNVEFGIKIYFQTTGIYFNGPVNLKHTISWLKLEEYKEKEISNIL